MSISNHHKLSPSNVVQMQTYDYLKSHSLLQIDTRLFLFSYTKHTKCATFITQIQSIACRADSREPRRRNTNCGEGTQGVRANNYTAATGLTGLGRDHKLVHPTMCASFLAVKSGSSISEAEAAEIASSGGMKPLRSIRLENTTEEYVMQWNVDCTWSVTIVCEDGEDLTCSLTSGAWGHITSHSSWLWCCCNCTGSQNPLHLFYLTRSP